MKSDQLTRYFLILVFVLVPVTVSAELKPDRMGDVKTLPEQYPSQWILVHDVAFNHMFDGKTIVMDATADTIADQFKGMFNSSLVGQLAQGTVRPEIYVAETFYSRGTRGTRTDVLTIYDKSTLSPIDEVDLGNNSRALTLPLKYAVQLIDDEKLLLVYNFSPAMSVSVVDIRQRELLNVVALPGCAPIYPTGQRGFSALCGEGAIFTVQLDADGQVKSTVRSEAFFDVDADPLFAKPAIANGIGYFPSYAGDIVPIDLRDDKPIVGERWSMTDDETAGWRPGGVAIADADANGIIYMLMHPGGGDGSHSNPGLEVWAFDPVSKERLARHELKLPAISMALTRDTENPLLVVTNVEMQIDVYAAKSGEFLRTLADFGGETPLLLLGAK